MKRLIAFALLLNASLLACRLWQQLPANAQEDRRLTKEWAEILSYFSVVELDDGKGEKVKSIRITGVNLQVVNGLGATDGRPNRQGKATTNGVGNVILGYNEARATTDRTGSHNLVIGTMSWFSGKWSAATLRM